MIGALANGGLSAPSLQRSIRQSIKFGVPHKASTYSQQGQNGTPALSAIWGRNDKFIFSLYGSTWTDGHSSYRGKKTLRFGIAENDENSWNMFLRGGIYIEEDSNSTGAINFGNIGRILRADAWGGCLESGPKLMFRSSGAITWSGTTNWYDTTDLAVLRDGAGTLALRNGINGQTFRIYNTTDSGISNYERAKLAWESNTFVIGTEIAGTSVTPRNIAFTGGNVGIGTTSPANKLHIDGTDFPLKLTNPDQPSDYVLLGSYGYLNIRPSSVYYALVLRNSANDTYYGTMGASQGRFSITYRNHNLVPDKALNIDVSGNIGLCTGTPAAKLDISDTTSAGSGSLAASTLNIASTWNTTGTPTLIKANVTDTASNAASLLMDLQVGGVVSLVQAKMVSYKSEAHRLALGMKAGFGLVPEPV